jgi:hypothetical protein
MKQMEKKFIRVCKGKMKTHNTPNHQTLDKTKKKKKTCHWMYEKKKCHHL